MDAYGLDYWEVMDLPLTAFWTLSRQIDRIRAEKDLRALRVAAMGAHASNEEAVDAFVKSLRHEIGEVTPTQATIDRASIDGLKASLRGLMS